MRTLQDHLHHLFIPKRSNNYRAKILHIDFLTFYLVIALIFTVAVKQLKAGAVLGFATDITTEKLFELTNEERAKNNLPLLTYNDKLSAAAYNKAQNMFKNGYWAHFGPDGTTPWSFITGSGYKYSVAGENLAKGFYFSDAVVNAWMNSPTHRANLLRDNYKDVGYAIVSGNLAGEDTTLVVQMFGAPLTAAVVEQTKPPIQEDPLKVPAQDTSKVQKEAPVVKKPYYQPASAVLSKSTTQTTPKINLFPALFNMNMLFLLVLATALLLDFYYTKRLDLAGVGSKNLAHIFFVGFIILGVVMITKGGFIH